MKTSILVTVWNKANHTYTFLSGIKPYMNPDREVLIYDNGSNDGTQGLLESWRRQHAWLKVYSSGDNIGFSKANNFLALNSSGELLILMNNDIKIMGDFISIIENALTANPQQIVGARLIDFKAGWNQFYKEDCAIVIRYLEGWCLGITRNNWTVLNGFDEIFTPADYEDCDLSYRAEMGGLELKQLLLPIIHVRGQTAVQLPDREKLTKRNRTLFAQKYNLRET